MSDARVINSSKAYCLKSEAGRVSGKSICIYRPALQMAAVVIWRGRPLFAVIASACGAKLDRQVASISLVICCVDAFIASSKADIGKSKAGGRRSMNPWLDMKSPLKTCCNSRSPLAILVIPERTINSWCEIDKSLHLCWIRSWIMSGYIAAVFLEKLGSPLYFYNATSRVVLKHGG